MSSLLKAMLVLVLLGTGCDKPESSRAPAAQADSSTEVSPTGRYGAMAFSPKSRVGGYVLDARSAREAGEQAVEQCRRDNRNDAGCRVVQRIARGCMALAVDKGGIHAAGTDSTARAACGNARAQCNSLSGKGCVASTFGCVDDQSMGFCKQFNDAAQSASRPAPPSRAAQGPYGAVAVSADGLHAGFSDGKASRAQAEAAAIASCDRDAGRRCESKVWFHDACGALAMGDDGAYGTGWGNSPRQACAWALQSCRDAGGSKCEANYYACSPRKLQGTCDGTFTSR